MAAPDREFRSWHGLQVDDVKSARERAEEKRQEKLANVAEMVQRGSLVIRKMTEEERQRYPPRPIAPRRFPQR